MQIFKLIRAFRDWSVDSIFTRSEQGRWTLEDEFTNAVSHVCDTLLDVGGYFEDITPVVWTPALHSFVWVVTGAGEVKRKEFTGSGWFTAQKNFMGYFATESEARNRVDVVRDLLGWTVSEN